jgi:hypothetical protein
VASIRCRCTDYGKWKCEITWSLEGEEWWPETLVIHVAGDTMRLECNEELRDNDFLMWANIIRIHPFSRDREKVIEVWV